MPSGSGGAVETEIDFPRSYLLSCGDWYAVTYTVAIGGRLLFRSFAYAI